VIDLVVEKITLKNFLSFGNLVTEVDLQQPGTTLIIGENLDSGGSSGAGKTTLISAICFVIYDKVPSGISKDRLINNKNGKKDTLMEVVLYMKKGADSYKIRRARGPGGGIQLFCNGKDITPDSVANFNLAVEELIGISYAMFSQIVLFSGNSRPFLDMSVGEQRALIEELFKITILSQKANALKRQASDTEKEIGMQKVLIKQQELQRDNQQKRVKEAEDRVARWNAQREADLKKLEEDLQKLANVDFNAEEELHEQIKSSEAEVSVLSQKKNECYVALEAKKKERSPHIAECTIAESSYRTKKQAIDKLRSDLEHLRQAKCPFCGQDYHDAKIKIPSLEEQESNLHVELNKLEVKIAELKVKIDEFKSLVEGEVQRLEEKYHDYDARYREQHDYINELKSYLTYKSYKDHLTASNLIATLQQKLEMMLGEANPHVEALNALKHEEEIKIDYDAVDALLRFHEHQQFMVKLLIDKNSFIRKNLISEMTPYLNKQIGIYTERLNLPHMVLFQPDMSCDISQLGLTLDHGNLSNGEKKKLNIALCLAFRDVRTRMHSCINVLFTDEVDGGSVSGVDVDSLIGLLKKKAWEDNVSIFIISHRPEFEGRCDRNLVVRKENGFSSLILQPEE
jgi:DNA repair exonuclease SbcCD ATPase subunit